MSNLKSTRAQYQTFLFAQIQMINQLKTLTVLKRPVNLFYIEKMQIQLTVSFSDESHSFDAFKWFCNCLYSDYFQIEILKACMHVYKKPFTRLVEEGTYITSHEGELLNSKNEWHQAD